MFETFMAFAKPGPNSQVLDLGVTPDVSLPESNHFEQTYPYPHSLTAVSIEPVEGLQQRFNKVRFLQIASGRLPFEDDAFDACFCSAVIEHVGNRHQQRDFIAEIARVSRCFVLTTPNRWFPLDFHTILPLVHWLPQTGHQAVLRALGKDFWAHTDNLNLLSMRDLEAIMPASISGHVHGIKLFGLNSNLVCLGARKD
jgi:SAM-dependent methyltransferase